MVVDIKKISFVVLGLAIITATFAIFKLNSANAAKKDGKKFDDWVVSCSSPNKKNKTPEICSLVQQVNITQEDTVQNLASFQIRYFGSEKKLKMIQTLPLGVSLESGTSVITSKKLISPGKFTYCLQDGCRAIADITKEDLELLNSGTDISVGVIGMNGNQVNIPFSSKGLTKGLKFIK